MCVSRPPCKSSFSVHSYLCMQGGEKKRNEILQLSVLEATVSILDEIDSGLDIDALRDVASAVNGLKRPESAILMVTHYKVGCSLRSVDVIYSLSCHH